MLLSADAALASAFAAGSLVHKPLEAAHQDSVNGAGQFQDSISYNPADEAAGLFDGVAAQPVHSQTAVVESPSAVQPDAPARSHPAQHSASGVQSRAQVHASEVSTDPSAKISGAQRTISATSTVGSATTMTLQLTASLRTANGPPASAVVSQVIPIQTVTASLSSPNGLKNPGTSSPVPQGSTGTVDLFQSIVNDISAIASGGGSATLSLGSASLGGVITFSTVTVDLTVSGTSVTAVSISATSASLNLGGAVTSTIGQVNGSYDVSTQKFSLTLNSVRIGFSSFVNISADSVALSYTGGNSTSVNLTNGTATSTATVSLLTLGINNATVFAGLNGPASNSDAVGVELSGANLALALMSASGGSVYYGVAASATSLSGVGLPGAITVGTGDLDVQVNASNDGSNVVDFNTSFAGPGLTVQTGPGSSVNLDYTGSLIQVAGTLDLGVTDNVHISGGFRFTQTATEMDIVVGSAAFAGAQDLNFVLGSEANPFFSATGSVSMTLTATTFTVNSASLTVNTPLKIASVLEVDTLSASLSNLAIDLATGDLSGTVDSGGVHDPVLTLTAASASLFPGSTAITGSITATTGGDGLGFQGTFDLQTGAFSVTLEQLHLAIGAGPVFTADASNVLVTYNPASADPHQQLVSIGSGTITFDLFSSPVSGSVTNLVIYADGFQFGSLTVTYTGSLNLGPLSLTDPSVTLTDFAVTFGGGNATFTETGSLTVAVDSASLTVGPISASAGSLSVTVSLDPSSFGQVNVFAGTLSFQFAAYLSVSATNITINPDAASGDAYLTVGTASVTVSVTPSFTIGGSASDFSVVNNNGTPEFQAGTNFGFTLTPPSPSQLGLPSWLGFSITQFGVSWQGNNFQTDPANFHLTLSASITSLPGLGGTVSISGGVTDAIIDVGGLGNWLSNPTSSNFPITFGPDGGISGSVSGTLFGMDVSASFVGGVVIFNAEGGILSARTGGTVIAGPGSSDTMYYGSGFYIGLQGSAGIPGIGTISISLGFSNLGPLSFYLSYTGDTPLILDPDTGLAITGFSAGVAFNQTMQTPNSATDLPAVLANALTAITGSPTGSPTTVNLAQWQQNLELATAAQYVASGGGTNLTAAYSQPFMILASVTLDDAYLSPDAFQIVGTMVLGINPHPGAGQAPVSILINGTVTLGGSSALSAASGYLYASITSSSASLMFLVNEPGSAPIESFGGSLSFAFTQTNNGVTTSWTHGDTGSPNGFTMTLSGFFEYSALGYANVNIQGSVTLSVTPDQMTIDLSGDVNVSFLGDLGDATGEIVLLYPGSTYAGTSAPNATSSFTNNSGSIEIYGALELSTGSAFTKLASYGLTVNGAALFQINTTGQNVLVNLPPAPSAPPGTLPTPFIIQGSVIFDMTITGTSSAFATVSYQVSGTTLFQMQAFLDIRLTDTNGNLGLQMFADINSLTLGPPGSSFLSFSGFGLIVINGSGLAAEISLTLGTGGTAIAGITFNANFDLVINTTSQDVSFTVPSVTVPTSSGSTSVAGISIYDGSGNLVGMVTSLVIPAGPPEGLQTIATIDGTSTGTFATTGAAGPYVVVTGSGSLTFFQGTSSELDLNGFFYFQMSYSSSTGFVLALVVNVSGTLPGVSGTATVTGALQVDSSGVVALLAVSASGGGSSTSYGLDITLDASFQLAIDTQPAGSPDVTEIGGVTLPTAIAPQTFLVEGTGTLSLYLTTGTGFQITGSIVAGTTTINGNSVDILEISGTITATVSGSTLLTATVNGELLVLPSQGGLAGELNVTLNAGNPLDGSGFSFNGSFDFEINTTGADQTAPALPGGSTPITISGGSGAYSEIHANGTLTFGNATNGFALAGDFYLSVSSSGLVITTRVGFTATLGGSTVMTLNASGAMEITSAGLAASFTLTASSGSPFSMSGAFSFSGAFTLQINTTNQAVPTIGSTAVNLPKGPYFQIAVTGATLTLGSSSNGLTLNGGFILTIGSGGLAVSSTATLDLVLGGTTFFSLTANGALLINSSGIAAKITLGTGTQPGDSNFSFNASFLLELNTTGSPVATINNQTVNLPGGSAFFMIEANGSLALGGGAVSMSGAFNFTISGGSVQISINAELSIFGILFTVNGDAGLYSDGIALSINLSLGGSTSPTVTIIPGVLALSGTFDLQVNTTGTSHFGVNADTIFNVYVSASFNVFGFSLAGTTFDISVSGGVFSATGQVGFNFFGFVTFTVDFYFDSNGSYWFYGNTYVQLGSNSFNIHGSLTVEFASNSEVGAYDSFSNVTISHNFYLHVDGGVTAFGYTFADIGADVSINGSNVSISVYVSVNLGLFSIGGTVTINLGTISPPPAPPPPPPIAILNNGVLTLNIGPGATLPALPNQDYTITLAADNGSAPGGTENLWVNDPGVYTGPAEYAGTSNSVSGAPGGTVEYTGVTSIVVNTGNNNTSINIDNSVTIPVTITSGTGTNTYVTGGGRTTITGGGGSDTVVGGTGNVTFTINGGTAVFVGGPAQNVINNDPGTLTVVLGGASSHDYNNYDLNGSVLSFWDTGGTHYSDTINGAATINLTTPSTGTAAFTVENFPVGDFSLTVNGNGNSGASIAVTNNGDLDLNGNTIGVNGGSLTLQSITSVTLIGGSAGDHLNVTNSADYGTVNLLGNAAGENFTMNFQGSGTYAVNVTGAGSGNTLTINGTNSNNIYNVNGSPVTLGNETVNYSGVQNLVLNTFNGTDTVNIGNTSTTTTVNGGSGSDTFNIQAISSAVTINLGSGTNTVNVGTLAPTESGGTLNSIQALLTVNGSSGGTNTLYLDDSGDNSAATATLAASSLAGVLGAGGSLDYSGIANFNLYLGNGDHTMNVQGMNGAVNISLGGGVNQINLGSNAGPIVTDPTTGNAANTGSILDRLVGTLIFTGAGDNTVNVDDSGGNKTLVGAMTPTSIKFINPATDANLIMINLPNVVAINMALSQVGDTFVVADTFTSSSTSPVVVIDGDGGDDTFIVLDTHAVMTLNGGDGADSFYNFGNSSVLNLNGNAGDDTFYVYASVSQNTTNVGPGAADSNGNTVYSYRVNAPVNINGGTGNDKVYIFATVLNDVITINGAQVTGAGIDVTFTNVEQLVVEGLGGNDTFYIESITIPTTIVGDGSIVPIPTAVLNALGVTPPDLTGGAPPPTSFNDTFYVGWQGASYIPGSLAGIAAPLTIEGDNGPNLDGTTPNTPGTNDTIYVTDSGDVADRNFTLTSTTLTGDAFGAGGLMTYDGAVENLNLYTGAGNNTLTVNGTGTATQTSIYGGDGNDTFVVNDSNGGALASPLALFGGLNTFAGDTLTVNGAPEGNTFDLTGFTIDGAGATISYEQMEKLTINAGGATTFNVNGDSIPTYLNGGAGNDAFNVNSNTVSLYLTSGAGDDTYAINANAGLLTATGDSGNDAGNDSFTVNGNSGTLILNGGAGNDTFVINGNSGVLTVNGGAGNDSFTINSLSSAAALDGGAGNDSFTVNAPLSAALTVTGGGDSGDVLTVNGTSGNDYFTINGSAVSGVGATISYSGTNLVVNGVAGDDTFQIAGTSSFTTRVNGGIYGNDTFNVQAATGALYLTGGAVGNSVFNLGSLAPVAGGTLANLVGPVFIAGGTNMLRLITLAGTGVNTVNLDDSGDAVGNTGNLTSSSLTGLGMGAGVTFVSVNTMNIYLGSGDDTFNVRSTNSTTVTTLNAGAGANLINVGSLAPVPGGTTDGIQGALIVVGNGSDTMNVDDTGDSTGQAGTLTSTTLTGLGMGASGVAYSGVAVLNINLGAGNDTFNIQGTNAATVTTLNTGAGVNTVNVGSLAPATGGIVDHIQGALTITGSGADTLNVDDSGSGANKTGALTPTTITGLGMGVDGIIYTGMGALNISLGSGNDSFTVNEINVPTITTLDGGSGTDTATLNFAQDFAGTVTLLGFENGTLTVGRDFLGTLSDTAPGGLQQVTIGRNFLGTLTAGTISLMTIGGAATGRIFVDSMGTLYAPADTGNLLLDITQGGVRRQIVATPVTGTTMPASVVFSLVYDGASATSPQLAIRVTNGSPATSADDVRFDLSLVTFSTTAKFNLSRADANGTSGLRNIAVDGDLLLTVTAPESAYMNYAGGMGGGVYLPQDNLTGVEVRDDAKVGSVTALSIMGVAFATLTGSNGTQLATTLNGLGAQLMMNSSTQIILAVDVFRVRFGEHAKVVLFMDSTNDGHLNDADVIFADQIVDNASVTAIVTMFGPTGPGGKQSYLQSIQFIGDGGSVDTTLPFAATGSITSTGAVGDIYLRAGTGIANVTAASFFGNVDLFGGTLTGTFQSTSADIGRANINSSGQIIGVTVFNANFASTARLIARGNLISQVNSGGAMLGLIAAQGDIGVIQQNADGTATVN
ncbi:MAG: hypothetical protein KGJ60_12810, partial [Verrucomicrobiota bacterium]|nr:hypothetical protein [Verrucomicrobiota bacterium]